MKVTLSENKTEYNTAVITYEDGSKRTFFLSPNEALIIGLIIASQTEILELGKKIQAQFKARPKGKK